MSNSTKLLRRRIVGRAITWGTVGACVWLVLTTLKRLDARPRTDDASLTAETLEVVPDVIGRIVELKVHDEQYVKRGDPLFTLDPEPFRLRLLHAEAEVRMIEEQIKLGRHTVASQRIASDVAKTNIDAARARLQAATDSLGRLSPLLAKGVVTAEQVDLARTAQLTAETHYQESLLTAQQARQLIGDTGALQAQLEAARITVSILQRELEHAVVRAPFDGKVVGVKASVGQLVSPARPLFTLIDTRKWYVVANFRETELGKIREGQPVDVYAMSNTKARLSGVVKSTGSAVLTLEDLSLAGLSHVPATLNWVRIAKRYPVRIELEQAPDELMRIGASAVVVVHSHD